MTKPFTTPFAVSGDRAPIPLTDINNYVNYTDGYTPDYSADPAVNPNAKNVERSKQNTLFHDITEAIGDMQRHGYADWDTAFAPYDIGSYVRHDDKVWRNTVSNNSSVPGSGSSWVPVGASNVALSGDNVLNFPSGLTIVASTSVFDSLLNKPPISGVTGQFNNMIGNGDLANSFGRVLEFTPSFGGKGKWVKTWISGESQPWYLIPASGTGANDVTTNGNLAQTTGDNDLVPMSQKAVTDALQWQSTPVGSVLAMRYGTSEPPKDSSLYRYVKLTANQTGAGQYNEGILTNQTTTGSGATLRITAKINFPSSPLHDTTIDLTNSCSIATEAGTTRGAYDGDKMQNVTGTFGLGTNGFATAATGVFAGLPRTGTNSNAQSASPPLEFRGFEFDMSTVARTGTRTKPKTVTEEEYLRIL